MKDAAAALAYLQPSSSIPFLAKRARPTAVPLQWQQHHDTSKPAVPGTAAAGRRNHDPLQQQQGRDRRPRQRPRRACLSLSATVAGEDAATSRLGGRRTGSGSAGGAGRARGGNGGSGDGDGDGDGEDGRTRGKAKFEAMMQLLPSVAAKVNVARVLQRLRDEGADVNLRTYRGCLAFLAKGGRGEEALMYLQEMEVSYCYCCTRLD